MTTTKTRGSVNRTSARRNAPLERHPDDGSLGEVSVPRRSSPEVTRLIDRIRKLVDERRRLEGGASRELLEKYRVEIERLQRRLATVVKRELPQ
jgi:hypothetical protein